MRYYTPSRKITFTAALLLSCSACATQSGPGAGMVATAKIQATIADINYDNRQVTLRTDDGRMSTLRVGPEARNFNQAKVGDQVEVGIYEAMVLDVQPDDGTTMSAGVESRLDRARLGEKPSGVMTNTVTLRAAVENIDYEKRTITLRGPGGHAASMKVGKDVKRFNEIKAGDSVVAVYAEALAISVSSPK